MLRTVNNLLPVVGKEGSAIIAKLMGQLADMAALSVHRVNFEVSIAHGGKNDALSIAADGGFSVVAQRAGQAVKITAVGPGGVDVVRGIDRPDVAPGIIGLGRTFRPSSMGGRKQDPVARREEVAAGRASFPGAYPPGVRGLAISCFHGH